MELFNITVKKADEVQYDYSYSGIGYSDYGTLEVANFKFGVLRSEEKNGLYIKISPIIMEPKDYIIDVVKISGETAEQNQKLSDVLADVSDSITHKDDYSDITGILQYLVGQIIPLIIDPEDRTITFPLNTLISTGFFDSIVGKQWLCFEWGADKDFAEMVKELLVPAIQIIGELIIPTTCTEKAKFQLLEELQMTENEFVDMMKNAEES